VAIDVPINDHPTAESFVHALRGFGDLLTSVELLSEMSTDAQAALHYGIHREGSGDLRVVEHVTVVGGKIVGLRQVNDAPGVRAAGTPA
jgi:hypothetical protein